MCRESGISIVYLMVLFTNILIVNIHNNTLERKNEIRYLFTPCYLPTYPAHKYVREQDKVVAAIRNTSGNKAQYNLSDPIKVPE